MQSEEAMVELDGSESQLIPFLSKIGLKQRHLTSYLSPYEVDTCDELGVYIPREEFEVKSIAEASIGPGFGRKILLAANENDAWKYKYTLTTETLPWLEFTKKNPVESNIFSSYTGKSIYVSGYAIYSGLDSPEQDVSSWVVIGTFGKEKKLIHFNISEEGSVFLSRNSPIYSKFNEPFELNSIQFIILNKQGAEVQIGNIHLYGPEPALVEVKTNFFPEYRARSDLGKKIPSYNITITVAGDMCGGGTQREFKENLLNDGNQDWNKWVDVVGAGNNSSWIQYDLVKAYDLTGYTLCSANDCEGRDPVAWELQGLIEETGQWYTIHSVAEAEGRGYFTKRWQWISFLFPEVARSVKAVRLNITSKRNINDDCIQLGNFRVYTEADPTTSSQCTIM